MTPQELNDRLLELAGECVHDWHDFSDNGMTRYFCKKQGCGASQYSPNPPAVGKGYVVTLGEMVRLARTKFGCEVCIAPNVVELWYRGVGRSEVVNLSDEVEPVLGRLLVAVADLAAVDGERA